METAGCEREMIMVETGTVTSAEYFTEKRNTFLSVSLSFWRSSLEKAGNNTVVIGVATKVIRSTKLRATL